MGTITYRINAITGVQTGQGTMDKSNAETKVDIGNLSQGAYILEITNFDSARRVQFMRQ